MNNNPLCKICSNKAIFQFSKRDRNNHNIHLAFCARCFYVFQYKDDFKDIYTSGEFSKSARSGELVPNEERVTNLELSAFYRISAYHKYLYRSRSILEVGSSIGQFVNIVRNIGIDCDGIEPDVQYAKFSKNQYGFDQYNSFFESFAPKKKYDLIIAFQVLEHIKEPVDFIRKAYETLNYSGRLLIEVPSFELHKSGNFKRFFWLPHLHYFSLVSILRLIRDKFNLIDYGLNNGSLFLVVEKTEKTTQEKNIRAYAYSLLIFLFSAVFPGRSVFYRIKEYALRYMVYTSNSYSLKKLIQRKKRSLLDKIGAKKSEGKFLFTHVSMDQLFKNAGDTVLSSMVREVFDNELGNKISWKKINVRSKVTHSIIQEINKTDALIIGGGGMFVPDTNSNTVSGWQWEISEDQIDQIKVPIIIFAVGYNYFYKQKPNKLFKSSLQKLCSKATFVGMRNKGSVAAVKGIISSELHEKIFLQPCPTTIISKITNKKSTFSKDIKVVFNTAIDRPKNRFDHNAPLVIEQLVCAARHCHDQGMRIHVACHTVTDKIFSYALEVSAIPHVRDDVYMWLSDEIVEYYCDKNIVIGMRGHAQMIPFGVGCNIISLVSHNKIKYFMQDTGLEEYLVDLYDVSAISSRIINLVERIVADSDQYKILEHSKNNYYDITSKNIIRIIQGIEID